MKKFWGHTFKNRFMLVVKMKEGYKSRNRVFRYNTDEIEIMHDAAWMLMFGNAEKVTVRSVKNRKKILATFTDLADFNEVWRKKFGEGAQWFVFKDRITNWN